MSMTIELDDLEVAILRAAMREAIVQAKGAPYEEAVVVLPVFLGIAKKLEKAS